MSFRNTFYLFLIWGSGRPRGSGEFRNTFYLFLNLGVWAAPGVGGTDPKIGGGAPPPGLGGAGTPGARAPPNKLN